MKAINQKEEENRSTKTVSKLLYLWFSSKRNILQVKEQRRYRKVDEIVLLATINEIVLLATINEKMKGNEKEQRVEGFT